MKSSVITLLSSSNFSEQDNSLGRVTGTADVSEASRSALETNISEYGCSVMLMADKGSLTTFPPTIIENIELLFTYKLHTY